MKCLLKGRSQTDMLRAENRVSTNSYGGPLLVLHGPHIVRNSMVLLCGQGHDSGTLLVVYVPCIPCRTLQTHSS